MLTQSIQRAGMASVMLLGVLAAPALGQRTRSAYFSRPSDTGPSSLIGNVGGSYTNLSMAGTPRPRLDYQSFGGQAIPRVSGFSGAMRGGYGFYGMYQVGNVQGASLYSVEGRRYSMFPASIGLANSAELRAASWLDQSMSLDQPLMGWESPRVDIPDAPYFVPSDPDMTAYHQFFGLVPAREEVPLPSALKDEPSYSSLVEETNNVRVREMLTRADRAFKIGTTPTAEDRYEQLAVARRLYASVLDLDRAAYMPALLSAHAALEQDHFEVAIRHLLEAQRRRPGIFSERPDVAGYFGDPELLEAQVRRFVRIGEQLPNSGAAWATQCYCAWVLQDPIRLRESLDRMEKLNQEKPVGARLEAFRLALQASTETN